MAKTANGAAQPSNVQPKGRKAVKDELSKAIAEETGSNELLEMGNAWFNVAIDLDGVEHVFPLYSRLFERDEQWEHAAFIRAVGTAIKAEGRDDLLGEIQATVTLKLGQPRLSVLETKSGLKLDLDAAKAESKAEREERLANSKARKAKENEVIQTSRLENAYKALGGDS